MWLRDSLPSDIQTARILVCGYDTRVYKSDSFQDLEALGRSLCADLGAIMVEEDVNYWPCYSLKLANYLFQSQSLWFSSGTVWEDLLSSR